MEVTAGLLPVAMHSGKEASQTRDYSVAETRQFARLAQIPRSPRRRSLGM